MAQLRQDYPELTRRQAEVVVIGPDSREATSRYWQRHSLPFVALPDPTHQVADRYGQEVKLLKLGRLPALMLIDKEGYIRYQHHGTSMRDIPSTQELVTVLDKLNRDNT